MLFLTLYVVGEVDTGAGSAKRKTKELAEEQHIYRAVGLLLRRHDITREC